MGEEFNGFGESYETLYDERVLTEVDNLNRLRLADGSHDQTTLQGILENLVPGVKEAIMPFAVSTTHQEYRDGDFWWLDQKPEDVARSGYRFHWHPSAFERVDVEIAEALHVKESLHPGEINVFISPKMSSYDAPEEIADSEHLSRDDMIRIHMLNANEDGVVVGKYMQSLLVRDIPLSAWVAMLRDENNIFNKSIEVDNEESALSVMKTHRQLTVPEAALPDGVVSIVEAVVPYITDPLTRLIVETQVERFKLNQAELHEEALLSAQQWLEFEVALADSLYTGQANPKITKFIHQLSHQWSRSFISLFEQHMQEDGEIRMSRELAAEIKRARINTLWVAAGVTTGNEDIIEQLGKDRADTIRENAALMRSLQKSGYSSDELAYLEVQNNQLIAQANIKAGGGCAGEVGGSFDGQNDPSKGENGESNYDDSESQNWKWKSGICAIKICPTRPGVTKVGPCSVCERCQGIYDKGGDPSKVSLVQALSQVVTNSRVDKH